MRFDTDSLEYYLRILVLDNVTVKCENITGATRGEGENLKCTDAETRKYGEQTGLETLVVHTVNDEC